jgi:MFS family permease
LPTGKWLGANLFCWGIATACTAATKSYGGLLATRVFCGAFEAAVPPSLMLLCSQWYTREEQSIRFSFWYLGIGFGQVFGGLISWAFQHVALTAPFASWRTMFVSLGCVTLTVGTAIFFFLPDTPMQARFLTDEEKVALLEHVKVNQTGIENRRFIPRQVLEAITDVQLWALVLILLLVSGPAGRYCIFEFR